MTGRRAAVFVASGALILSACGAFEADSGPSVTDAGGNAGDAGADASDATSGACDPKFPDDFAGCGCEGASVRDCSHVAHVTSPSACGRGSQRCENGRWSACTPIGSAPLDPPLFPVVNVEEVCSVAQVQPAVRHPEAEPSRGVGYRGYVIRHRSRRPTERYPAPRRWPISPGTRVRRPGTCHTYPSA